MFDPNLNDTIPKEDGSGGCFHSLYYAYPGMPAEL
jgi:hypothetical protein